MILSAACRSFCQSYWKRYLPFRSAFRGGSLTWSQAAGNGLSHRIGKVLRWLLSKHPKELVSAIATGLADREPTSSTSRSLDVCLSIQYLLVDFVTTSMVYAHMRRSQQTNSARNSRNSAGPGGVSFADPLLAALAELAAEDLEPVLSLSSLVAPLASLAKRSMQETNLTVLSVSASDSALILSTFLSKLFLARGDLQELQSSRVHRAALDNVFDTIRVGYQAMRPLYCYCTFLVQSILESDAEEASSELSSLLLPCLIENPSQFTSLKHAPLPELIFRVTHELDPLLELVEANAAPRSKILAAVEAVEWSLLRFCLALSRVGPNRLARVFSSPEPVEFAGRLLNRLQTVPQTPLLQSLLICVAFRLRNVIPAALSPAHLLRLDLAEGYPALCALVLILKAPGGSEALVSAIGVPSTLSLLKRATTSFLEGPNSQDEDFELAGQLFRRFLSTCELWTASFLSHFDVARLGAHFKVASSCLRGAVDFFLAESTRTVAPLSDFVIDAIAGLFKASSESEVALSQLVVSCSTYVPSPHRISKLTRRL